MKVLRFFYKLACCVVICGGLAGADSLQLRNGRHLQGKYIGGTTTAIGFMTGGSSVEYFSTSEVLALIFDGANDSPLSGLQPNPMKGQPGVHAVARVRRISASTRGRVERSRRQATAIPPPPHYADAKFNEETTEREPDPGQRRPAPSDGAWPSSP
jgi:hypothetical protein